MDHDLLLALAAIVTAIGGFAIGVLNFRLNARKSLVEELRTEIDRLRQDLKEQDTQHRDDLAARDTKINRLRRRIRYQARLMLDREKSANRIEAQNKSLLRKIDQFYQWGDQMGRRYNQMELALGDLQAKVNAADPTIVHGTAPLPPLPDLPARDADAR